MRRRATDQGFTLIEAILAIVMVGAAFVSISYLISNTTLFNINLDLSTTAVFLAREKMAETTAKPFANVQDVAQTSFGGDFSTYRYQVAVDYVNAADLNTVVVGPTDYKRVVVTVTATGWLGTVQLYSLKTNI